MAKASKSNQKLKLPPAHDWRTTDTDEINKRRQRAREEAFVITNTDPRHPVFSNFRVKSASGLTYSVEIRDLNAHQSICDCVDFRTNGLGFCKHVEAVSLYLQARRKQLFKSAQAAGSNRIEVTVDPVADNLCVLDGQRKLPRSVGKWFNSHGRLLNPDVSGGTALDALRQLRDTGFPRIRLSQEIEPWLENRRRASERRQLRHEYEVKVQKGEWPAHETTVPLFPYQREGMLHLAFTERALLADEMGLGKTIQAIAACALLRRLGKARRVLVVTPASLKTEWEEQIRKFTTLDFQLVFGGKIRRLKAYHTDPATPFFTIVNYEQMVADALDVNARLAPDIVVLDEAQRIKNWSTKTTRASRLLFPVQDNAGSAALSAEERTRANTHRERGTHKLKLARVLGEGGFGEEARLALLEAIHTFAGALAVEHRLPEPPELKDALLAPLAHRWAEALPALKTFVQEPGSDWKPVAECLARV